VFEQELNHSYGGATRLERGLRWSPDLINGTAQPGCFNVVASAVLRYELNAQRLRTTGEKAACLS